MDEANIERDDLSVCMFADNPSIRTCATQCSNGAALKILSEKRFATVVKKSKSRVDTLHKTLSELSQIERDRLKYHEVCISTYTSKAHIKREKKRAVEEVEPVVKRNRRSSENAFVWKEHCLFCGKRCQIEKDYRHPDRWEKASECRTSERDGRQTFRDRLLEICDQRNDAWSIEVRLRLSDDRAVSDLHAADARYHDNCRKKFIREVYKSKRGAENEDIDDAFKHLIQTVVADKNQMWTSIELDEVYRSHGGKLCRKMLLDKVTRYLKNEVMVLNSPGIASILVFKSHADSVLRIQNVDVEVEKDCDDEAVRTVAKQVISEIKDISFDKGSYDGRMNISVAKGDVSPTFSKLLSLIEPKTLNPNALPSLLIGNMVTAHVAKRFTTLSLSLAIMVRKKKLVEKLHQFGVVSSYDELKRFRTSAAAFASTKITTRVLRHHSQGLVQGVADNFDCVISSMNGLKQTHSLALIMTQHGEVDDEKVESTIPRLKKADLTDVDLRDVPIPEYQGPKKPSMPHQQSLQKVQSLKILAMAATASGIAKEIDFEFFKSMAIDPNTPEYAGFNSKQCREAGISPQEKTMCMYTPLIDETPADPSAIMACVDEAIRLTADTGQEYTILTYDQQLYKLLVDLLWTYPNRYQKVIARLGGMHLLMSFIGCVGNLMSNTGLLEIMKSTFAGVEKMLLGSKYFPQNLRALRMVVEELLRPYITQFDSSDKLDEFLENISKESKTTKLWVENLIKPVQLMMMFVRAEREGDWPLHLKVVSKMLPYFFAAGHHNYARYATYYLNDMKNLPPVILARFLKGEHTTHHQKGIWNGMWSDMFIETTFMRFGKGDGGLVGVTLKPKSVKIWAYSLHSCTLLLHDLHTMSDEYPKRNMMHKEEMPARIKSDAADRLKLRKKLEDCINPLDSKNHPEELVNVASGRINTDPTINAELAIIIGSKQTASFIQKLPGGFYETLNLEEKVKCLVPPQRGMKIGETEVINTEAVYHRIIGLLATDHVTLKDVIKYELSSVPPSLFKENGDMRTAESKYKMKEILQVETSARNMKDVSASFVDGSATLLDTQMAGKMLSRNDRREYV